MSMVAIVSGSPGASSRLTGLLEETRNRLEGKGIASSWIQASDLPPEDLIYARFDSAAIADANRKVAEAAAVVIGSPVYKASYSGILKTYLDLLPQGALVGKPVLPVFIGGSIAHLLAIDYALKPVLSALGARYQLGGVYAVDSQIARTEQGGFAVDDETKRRLANAADELAIAIRAVSPT